MEEHAEHHESAILIGQDAHGGEQLTAEAVVADDPDHQKAAGPMDVSGEMFLWTLVTFSLVAIILSKIAWKPILYALEKREETIRKSIEDAEKVEQEMAAIDGNRQKIITEADDKAKDIVGRARQAGVEAERVIKDKAREEAGILLENANREINAVREKVAAELRQESVETAIALAGKLIGENLDDDRQRRLTDQLIKQL